MEKAKVYFTDFHTQAFGDGLPTKLKKLMKRAGIQNLDLDGKFVAIKMHFGELGNISYLRPNYARAVVDVVKELGGKPFLTDCNTMYPGSRKNALEHLECAWQNGFTPLTVGCPLMIGDGLKGTDDVLVPVQGGEYVKEAKIGRAVMDADVFVSLTHFKGHEMTGFGGAIKNISIGIGSSEGKGHIHSGGTGGSMWGADQNAFLEAMGEAGKSVVDALDGQIVYINVMNRLSVDCDCDGNPAEPDMHDIGILASCDPVALDQACVDLVYAAKDGASLIQRIESRNGIHTIEHAAEIGLGSREYTLVNID